MLARSFDSLSCLFHMVFNRIVENCHEAFIIPVPVQRMMAWELLAAGATCASAEKRRFRISYPRRDNISSCLHLPTNLDEGSDPQRG